MEIEIRAYVDSLRRVENLLNKNKATFLEEQRIVDEWYCPEECYKFEDVKQDIQGSYGLRVRTQYSEDNHRYSELNCKVLERENDHNSFHEYHTEIGNSKDMRKILETMGFKLFCRINKTRKTYELGNCKINLEKIKGFRPAIELEIIDHDHNRETHYKTMDDILRMLEVRPEDYIPTSITAEYMKHNSFKKSY